MYEASSGKWDFSEKQGPWLPFQSTYPSSSDWDNLNVGFRGVQGISSRESDLDEVACRQRAGPEEVYRQREQHRQVPRPPSLTEAPTPDSNQICLIQRRALASNFHAA